LCFRNVDAFREERERSKKENIGETRRGRGVGWGEGAERGCGVAMECVMTFGVRYSPGVEVDFESLLGPLEGGGLLDLLAAGAHGHRHRNRKRDDDGKRPRERSVLKIKRKLLKRKLFFLLLPFFF
jgi:hypothetical protein